MTTVQKIRGDPDGVVRAIQVVLIANRYLKQNKGEFTKLLAKESGVNDPVVAGLIHEEIMNLYSDTGVVSDEAMQEFIAQSKETLNLRGKFYPLMSRISALLEKQWAS